MNLHLICHTVIAYVCEHRGPCVWRVCLTGRQLLGDPLQGLQAFVPEPHWRQKHDSSWTVFKLVATAKSPWTNLAADQWCHGRGWFPLATLPFLLTFKVLLQTHIFSPVIQNYTIHMQTI